MIKIKKTKAGKYNVVIQAKNGNVLYQSVPLKRKQSALKNIAALFNLLEKGKQRIKDETGK